MTSNDHQDFRNKTSQIKLDQSASKKKGFSRFPALSQFGNWTISHSIQLEIKNGWWHWKLEYKVTFNQNKSFSKLIHKWEKTEPQNAASTFLLDRPSEQDNKFADSLQLTHFELESKFYTVGKLKISNFKCLKWHWIWTSVQRVMFDQRDTV